MRIAFISRKKLDKMEWSGTAYSIYNNLLINNIDVVKIDNLNDFFRKVFILKREFFKFFKKIKYDERYNHFVSKNFSKQINKKLKKMNNVDVILTYDFYSGFDEFITDLKEDKRFSSAHLNYCTKWMSAYLESD